MGFPCARRAWSSSSPFVLVTVATPRRFRASGPMPSSDSMRLIVASIARISVSSGWARHWPVEPRVIAPSVLMISRIVSIVRELAQPLDDAVVGVEDKPCGAGCPGALPDVAAGLVQAGGRLRGGFAGGYDRERRCDWFGYPPRRHLPVLRGS